MESKQSYASDSNSTEPASPEYLIRYHVFGKPKIVAGTTAALRASMHSLDIFLDSVESKETKRQYRSRLALFLNFVYEDGTIGEKAKRFIEDGLRDRNLALEWGAAYMLVQKANTRQI